MEPGIKTVIKQICAEKGLDESSVLETINSALAAAFRKDFGDKTQNIKAEFDPENGHTQVYDEKEVVENLTPEEVEYMEKLKAEREKIKEMLENGEITPEELRRKREQEEAEREVAEQEGEEGEEIRKFNPKTEIEEQEAKKIKKSYKIGVLVRTDLEIPGDFGRMAAQTAKQVIIQKLREAERNVIYQDFKEHEGEIMNGMVQKFEGRNIVIDFQKAIGILPPLEQIRRERLNIGDRVKVYIVSVGLTTRGSEIIVSRAHSEIVKELFTQEIPEIANGIIEIKGVSREAGSRTKIAVHTDDESIDPIGSCIGQKGARIQTIINELGGEKIDIIEFDENVAKYINNALLPAKITNVEINEKEKKAIVTVPSDQLSLTIGRAGQNVRLASKLTDWVISVKEQETGKEISEDEGKDTEHGAQSTEQKSETGKEEGEKSVNTSASSGPSEGKEKSKEEEKKELTDEEVKEAKKVKKKAKSVQEK